MFFIGIPYSTPSKDSRLRKRSMFQRWRNEEKDLIGRSRLSNQWITSKQISGVKKNKTVDARLTNFDDNSNGLKKKTYKSWLKLKWQQSKRMAITSHVVYDSDVNNSDDFRGKTWRFLLTRDNKNWWQTVLNWRLRVTVSHERLGKTSRFQLGLAKGKHAQKGKRMKAETIAAPVSFKDVQSSGRTRLIFFPEFQELINVSVE